VYSSLGQGTTLKICFPASSGARKTPDPPDGEQAIDRGRGVILVIDDESAIRQMARQAIERVGYEVKVAASGEEGLRLFDGCVDGVSAILLDLTMPGLGGVETFM
jgi:response regulator RpfG family c-di-GMP phosphodiesterase